jgi:hypothetical protein
MEEFAAGRVSDCLPMSTHIMASAEGDLTLIALIQSQARNFRPTNTGKAETGLEYLKGVLNARI